MLLFLHSYFRSGKRNFSFPRTTFSISDLLTIAGDDPGSCAVSPMPDRRKKEGFSDERPSLQTATPPDLGSEIPLSAPDPPAGLPHRIQILSHVRAADRLQEIQREAGDLGQQMDRTG